MGEPRFIEVESVDEFISCQRNSSTVSKKGKTLVYLKDFLWRRVKDLKSSSSTQQHSTSILVIFSYPFKRGTALNTSPQHCAVIWQVYPNKISRRPKKRGKFSSLPSWHTKTYSSYWRENSPPVKSTS